MCAHWLDIAEKICTGLGGLSVGIGALIAAVSYKAQQRIKRAEFLTSLYKEFFTESRYNDARVWLDYGKLHDKLNIIDEEERIINEEKFTDFLNFFEYVGVLYSRNHLTYEQVYEVFDYYLKKIKNDPDC